MFKNRFKYLVTVCILCLISLFPASLVYADTDTTYQEQNGYNGEEGLPPESFDGIYDGKESQLNSQVSDTGCTGTNIYEGAVGTKDHGAYYGNSWGQNGEGINSNNEEIKSWVEISGGEKKEDYYSEKEVSDNTSISEQNSSSNNSSNNNSNSNTNNTANNKPDNSSNINTNHDEVPEETPLPSLKDLVGLSDYDKYNMMFGDLKMQMQTNNTYNGNGNPSNNSSSSILDKVMSGNITTINGKDYFTISDKEFENATQTDDGIFEIATTTGNTIRVELELVPGKDDEWQVKEYVVAHKEYEEEDDDSDSRWTTYREEELYCYWEWKNLTNDDWIRLHGNHYYPISGSSSTSRTHSSTLKWELGHGPYDDGTWSFKMIPRMKLYQERYRRYTYTWVDSENKTHRETGYERLTREREKWAAAVYYEVTVPLVCNTCPEITICLSDENGCDCGDLNTKCDDELEPEYVIDHRSELTN